MTSFLVGCDNINGKETSYINHFIEVAEAKGHTCESLGVGPNVVQRQAGSSSSEGYTLIQIGGGCDGWTAADMVVGLQRGYYHGDLFAQICSSEFTGNWYISSEAYETYQMELPHDAQNSANLEMFQGKTPKEFTEEYGQWFKMCLNDTFDGAIEMFFGETTSEDEEDNSSNTYKQMILDLISVWAGQVLCYSINEEVFIHKLPLPSEDYKQLQEKVNITDGSFKVTDIDPDTTNTLVITYDTDKSFTLKDEALIERFGEKKEEFTAVKYVTVTEDTEEDTTETITTDTTEVTSTTDISTDIDIDTDIDVDTTSTDVSTTDTTSSKVVEEPITDYDEAVDYGISKFYEIKADDGRKIDIDVIGETTLKHGDWIQLYIPSFNEQCYMFVDSTSISLDPSGDFITSISLVDAPPLLSEPTVETEEEDEETEEDSTDEESTDEEES